MSAEVLLRRQFRCGLGLLFGGQNQQQQRTLLNGGSCAVRKLKQLACRNVASVQRCLAGAECVLAMMLFKGSI